MTEPEDRHQARLRELCERKRHHPSKREARRIAALIRKKKGNALFAYKCPACKAGWLLTTQPQSASDVTKAERGQRAPLAPPHPSRRTTCP